MITLWGPASTQYRFFWSWEVASFSDEEDSRQFVEQHLEASGAADSARNLLNPHGAGASDNDQLIGEMAGLLMNGKAIAGDGSFAPLWRYQAPFFDRVFALGFLGRFRHDPIAIAQLRSLLGNRHRGADLSRLSEDAVLAEIATLLGNGLLVVGFRAFVTAGDADQAEPERAEAAASEATSPAPDTAEADQVPTFANTDAAAQAATLKAASKTGAALVDECAPTGGN